MGYWQFVQKIDLILHKNTPIDISRLIAMLSMIHRYMEGAEKNMVTCILRHGDYFREGSEKGKLTPKGRAQMEASVRKLDGMYGGKLIVVLSSPANHTIASADHVAQLFGRQNTRVNALASPLEWEALKDVVAELNGTELLILVTHFEYLVNAFLFTTQLFGVEVPEYDRTLLSNGQAIIINQEAGTCDLLWPSGEAGKEV